MMYIVDYQFALPKVYFQQFDNHGTKWPAELDDGRFAKKKILQSRSLIDRLVPIHIQQQQKMGHGNVVYIIRV